MTDGPPRGSCEGSRLARILIVLAGIVLGQFILYGPSLAGRKILLPLDILAQPGMYLPQTPEVMKIEPRNTSLSDLVEVAEPTRKFGYEELHAGRIPMWTPYNFAGAPFTRSNFSPFSLMASLVASPVILAWTQMLAAMVAGFGAYLFCRRVLRLSFWQGAIAAWCYPLTGFFILWLGFPTSPPVVWLPWILLAVDKTTRRTSAFAPIGLALATCLVLISGQIDVAAQVMLASGLYALWILVEEHREGFFQAPMRKATAAVVAGWILGFLLAAPYLLPVLDYARSGARLGRRGSGDEERPPAGIKALPQIVLPYMYGTRETGSLRLVEGNELESSAATYAGVVATLLVAPLAWCSRRHRRTCVFFIVLALVSVSWCLNVPGLVDLLRLPGLNMMSHNRFVFAASFAIVAMAAIGLEVLRERQTTWRGWFWIPCLLLVGLCGWCLFRCTVPAEPVATQLQEAVAHGYQVKWIHTVADVPRLKAWFREYYAVAAIFCGAGAVGWLLLRRTSASQAWFFPIVAAVLLADLLWFGIGRNPQCDPALYFPAIPALEEIRGSVPGRIIGQDCLPAWLASMRGLRDIRGYDGVDPARLVELAPLFTAADSKAYSYGLMRRLTPKFELRAKGELLFSPVLDMLNVRYLIGRGRAPAGSAPAFESEDYWVLINSNALPRAYVPEHVETVTNARERLTKLGATDFDARKVAYVEMPANVPQTCRGAAEIANETPTHVRVALRMDTAGLVVLADLWDHGWRAYLNGAELPVLRTNHALRGVIVPAGTGMLEFRYEPASLRQGFQLAGFAAVVLVVWFVFAWRRKPPTGEESAV